MAIRDIRSWKDSKLSHSVIYESGDLVEAVLASTHRPGILVHPKPKRFDVVNSRIEHSVASAAFCNPLNTYSIRNAFLTGGIEHLNLYVVGFSHYVLRLGR